MIYTYQCPKCGKEIEQTRRVENRDDDLRCKVCNFMMKRTVSSNVGAHFKGTGFHCRDYPKSRTGK